MAGICTGFWQTVGPASVPPSRRTVLIEYWGGVHWPEPWRRASARATSRNGTTRYTPRAK
jgi:hypothetical protein